MSIQRGRELFSKEQRKLFMKYPEDEWTIESYYTFSKYDLEIIMKHRKEENKLGFAIQLAALRYPGWSYSSNKTIPIEIIQYIANQVCTVPKALKLYSLRNNTSRDHIKDWNTLYLEKAISYKESIGEYIDYNLISHISPLGWEHINMLGEYTFNLNELESTELYRPLNI